MAASNGRLFCVCSGTALVGLLLVVGSLFTLCSVVHCSRKGVKPAAQSMPSEVSVPMPTPGSRGIVHNDYRCTAASTQLTDGYIVQYEPRADPHLVHHMLLYGCRLPPSEGSWDCKSTAFLCGFRDSPQIIFAWALNASGIRMPEGVGLKVGPSAKINYLVVQIHYGHPEDVPDLSAVSKETLIVHTTEQKQRFVAGIYLLGSGGGVEGGHKDTSVFSACKFPGPKAIHPFAFRTHAHSLGKQIVGYVVKDSTSWEVIGTRSPQDPQAFYPVSGEITVNPNDWLAVQCVFDTERAQHSVRMGPDSEDEMCNFYVLYYTSNDDTDLISDACWTHPPSNMHFPAKLPPLPALLSGMDAAEEGDGHSHGGDDGNHGQPPHTPQRTLPVTTTHPRTATRGTIAPPATVPPPTAPPPLPATSPPPPPVTTPPPITALLPPPTPAPTAPPTEPPTTTATPPQPTPTSGLVLAEDWPLNGYPIPMQTLGQITAVAIDAEGSVHVLHRGPVTWGFDSFAPNHTYLHRDEGPISVPTLLKFSSSGKPLQAWGGSLFYMPHGLTIDHEGSFWVTDTAMHQVFKFSSFGDAEPSLVLGKAFLPGVGYSSFCQPSSVAVERDGSFYVADGYCNHRILKYNSRGKLAEVWEAPVAGKNLFIPHKAILNAANTVLYVADRENRRVLSFATSEGGHGQVLSDNAQLGGTPYAISFNSSAASDWPMYGVIGGVNEDRLMGFTLDAGGERIDTWGPQEGFSRPHDMVVDGNAVYVTEIGPNMIWKFVQFPSSLPMDVQQDLEELLDSDHSNDHSQGAPPPPTSTHVPPPPPDPTHSPASVPPSDAKVDEEDSDDSAIGNNTNNSSTEQPDKKEDSGATNGGKKKPMVGVNVGVVVAVLAVLALIALVAVGVVKEHRLIRFKGWQLIHANERDKTIGVDPSGATTRREGEKKKKKKKRKPSPQKKLQSLLGPSHLGFSRLRTYDSNSEDEEFPVFNRV